LPCTTTGSILTKGFLADKLHSFGIPPQLKRQMEEKALETMGENKASYMMKDAIGQMPASDQQVCVNAAWECNVAGQTR